MQTSCFHNYSGAGRIIISRGWPRTGLGSGYKIFRPLAPGAWFRLPEYYSNQDKYRERYHREILAPLDAQQVYDRLHELADGAEPILLCWEKDPSKPGEWCHRRMVADWFTDKIGVIVPEYVKPAQAEKLKQPSLFEA